MIVKRKDAEALLGRKIDAPAYKKWYLLSADGTKNLGGYRTKKEAAQREREVQFFKHNPEALTGGLADGMDPDRFDTQQLLRGMKVEMEHTDDPEIAMEIAMDHLAEHPDYYVELEKMERKLKVRGNPRKKTAKQKAKRATKKVKRAAKTKTGHTALGAGAGALLLGPIGAIAGAVGGSRYHDKKAKKNPRKKLYIYPNKSAQKVAKRALERRKKLPKSKRGGLDAQQAHEEGVGSGVMRARDIAAGKRINAYQVKAFFDRHRGNYVKAKADGKKWEDSKAWQAWDLWGGEPLRKQVERAVKKDQKENPAGFADKEHDWNQVLIDTGKVKKTRKQILDYYKKNEKKIWPFLKGQTVLVILGIGKNSQVLRRKGPDGKYIKLTKLKGIDDPHSFEYWINRRAIEFHPVITGKTTPLVWVDLDVHPKRGQEAKLRKKAREAIPRIVRMLRTDFNARPVKTYESGKGGFHVEGTLPRSMDVDRLRVRLREKLVEMFADDPDFTASLAKRGQIRLDTTLIKHLGSLRAPYSMTVAGKPKEPITVQAKANPKRVRKNPAKDIYDLPEDVRVKILATTIGLEALQYSVVVEAPGGRPRIGKINIKRTPECGWTIGYSEAAKGWGPFLYDIAIELATLEEDAGVMPDRELLSDDARQVWRHYYKSRSDVKHKRVHPHDIEYCESYTEEYLNARYTKQPVVLNELFARGWADFEDQTDGAISWRVEELFEDYE